MEIKNKKIELLSFILIIVFFIGCDHNRTVLEEAGKVVRYHPDSALALLSKIETPYLLEGKEKADYWKLRTRAHYQKHAAMTTDSLILYSLDYYLNHQDTANLIESYLLAGIYYNWKNEPDSALALFTRGFETASLVNDSAYISLFLTRAGHIERSRNRNKESMEYFKTNILFDKNNHNSYYLIALSTDDDSTGYFLNKGVAIALQKGDTLAAAHYLRNYAHHQMRKKNYAEAIELVKKTGELSEFYRDFSANHFIMTELFVSLGKLDSAQHYLDKAKKEERKGSYGSYSDLGSLGHKNSVAFWQAIIDVKQNREISEMAIGRFNDSIIDETIKKNKILVEQFTERNALEQQNLKLLINKQRSQLILITLFSFFLIASVVVYLYILKRKQKIKEIEERTESLQKLFKEALNVKDEKQNNTQLFRKTLLQQLGIIRLVATTPANQKKELLPQIIDISNESVSTESLLNWNDLYSIINSVYDNFYAKLQEQYGQLLNEKEIQLCCLLCADFSTVEISAIMQQSMQTIYQRKSTIRNKLKIGDKQDIISFLSEQFAS